MNVWKYFEMAKKTAMLREDHRDFLLGAVGVRNDGTIVASSNGCVVIDPNDRRHFFSACHAEFRLCRKLDKNSIVFVVRVRALDGKYKHAKPCQTCETAMRKKGVRKVFYTISDNEYGVLCLKRQ